MFPVYIYDSKEDLPTEGTYFVVSGNGLWMHKDTGIVSGFVPVENISCLEDLKADALIACNLPHIPARIVWRIKTFFKEVVTKYDAEAATILYYNKDKQDFKVHIPEQNVSKGGVHYKRVGLIDVEGMEDYLRVGTIHSHCDFEAYHSGVDVKDEEFFDGLHCTFGHNDRDDFTVSASVVVNGQRSKIDPATCLEGIELVQGEVYTLHDPAEDWTDGLDTWMEQVSGHVVHPVSAWWGGSGVCPKIISKGDQVEWAGDMSTVSFKNTCGEGPFDVEEITDGKITINAKFGLARFSEKLFKKV